MAECEGCNQYDPCNPIDNCCEEQDCGCTYTTDSECVRYTDKDLECLGLPKGSTVEEILTAIDERLCSVLDGSDGLSAYQVAVVNGYTGTVEEWLSSLVGLSGDSAYQVWLDAGNTGTEQDFLDSLVGADGLNGTNGTNGSNGLSAYQIWINEGNTGTEQDFLNSLVGLDGADGSDGKSAYQIWIDAGNTGTQQDFLNSLRGVDGTNGVDGTTGDSAYQTWLSLGNTGTEQDFINSMSNKSGIAVYKDTQYTQLEPFSVSADTDTVLPNNSETVVDDQKPDDISSFVSVVPSSTPGLGYDHTQVLGRRGDGILLTIKIVATPTNAAATYLDVWSDIGGLDSKHIGFVSFYKGEGGTVEASLTFSDYMDSVWQDNPATLYVRSNGTVDIHGIEYVITRTHKARIVTP